MGSAAILAGGQATRFGGRDKSALLVDGATILDRQLAALGSVSDDLMIVGSASAGDAAASAFARGQHERASARFIPDIVPGCGPLGGVHAALTAARHGAVLLVACDM